MESYDIPAAGIGEASSVHLISRRCRSLSETRQRHQLPLKGKPLETQVSTMPLTLCKIKVERRRYT